MLKAYLACKPNGGKTLHDGKNLPPFGLYMLFFHKVKAKNVTDVLSSNFLSIGDFCNLATKAIN